MFLETEKAEMKPKNNGAADNPVLRAIQEALIEQARKEFSPRVVELWSHPRNRGRIERPDGFATNRGICGDTITIYLSVKNERITEAKYETDGCGVTSACGEAITGMAAGKTLEEAFALSPADLLRELGNLPRSHLHCCLLAANTLFGALANYLALARDTPEKPPGASR